MSAKQQTREWAAEYGRAALIGIAGALACFVFRRVVDGVQITLGFGTDVVQGARQLEWWQLLLFPTAGMGVAWLVQRFLMPEGRGAGFADIMEAVSVKRGGVGFRSAVARSLASMATIATGGSVGREGPIISLSSALASKLAAFLRTPTRQRGLLVGCGVAAGFAAAYNAPVAGAVFALEIVIGNFAMELFAPVVVSSATATLVIRYLAGSDAPAYKIKEQFELKTPWELAPYLLLGVLAGCVAVGFQWTMRRTERGLKALPIPRWALMMLGGLTVGALALKFPEVCGNGYGAVDEIINNTSPRFTDNIISEGIPRFVDKPWWQLIGILLALLCVKLIGTCVTVGSGGSGGVFTPSMFLGAALGGAVGLLAHQVAPEHTGAWGGYALVGMGCLVAGITRAPIMAVLVLFEMTLDYDIMVPLLIGGTTASLVARSLYPHSIYDEEFVAKGKTAPQGLEETVLVSTRVEDVMRTQPPQVNRSTMYADLVPLLVQSRASTVFVIADDRRYLGAIRIQDIVELASMGDLGPGIIALDIMADVTPVHPEDPLSTAFDLYETSDVDELPVVDAEGLLVGGVARKDVMSVLHVEVLKRQNLRAKFVRREADRDHTDYVELPKGVELARVPGHPSLFGRTLGESAIRNGWKLTVLSVVRHDAEGRELRVLPDAAMKMERGDDLIVLGAREDILRWRAEVGDV